ncbi:hypothetical protein [Sphingomonas sp. GB1N7]|uniref:hypothetical protein n=1 Tax=Parasphingomonas caseinilytica TaxID=3096158 RepID=UPI002FCC847C
METNDTLKKAGLAAVIILAPGGFILGATLAARYWQKRNKEKVAVEAGEAEADKT